MVVRPAAPADRPVLPLEVKASASGAGARRGPRSCGSTSRAIQAGQLEKNLALKPGDTLFVPQAARIFVTGEVRQPGAFRLQHGASPCGRP